MNFDRISNADQRAVAGLAFAIVNAIQKHREARPAVGDEEALVAVACLNEQMADFAGPEREHDVRGIARTLMRDAPRRQLPEFRALKQYLDNEFRRP